MSRSLAIVGILITIGAAGTQAVVGQENTTTQGVVVKNHMSDAERDRLMKEAMAKARRQLDQQKAEEKAALEKAAEEQRKDEAAQAKAEAAKKAEEERLAKKLAEEEKARDSKQDNMELKPLTPSDVAEKADDEKVKESETREVAEKKETESKKSESKSDDKEKKVTASAKSAEKSSSKSDDEPTDLDKVKETEKTVIETVSTNEPGSGLTVKTSMPVGDEARKAEQRAALARGTGREAERQDNRSGGETTLSGRVVGIMRSSNDSPRILVQREDRRMVQVVLENRDEMPAPGAVVTVKGREIGGGSVQVVSAYSVSISSGGSVKVSSTHVPAPRPVPMAPVPGMLPPPPPPPGVPLPIVSPLLSGILPPPPPHF